MGRIPKAERESATVNNDFEFAIDISESSTFSKVLGVSDTSTEDTSDKVIVNFNSSKNHTNIVFGKKLNSQYSIASVIEVSERIFKQNTGDLKYLSERADNLIKHGVKNFVGHDATVQDVWHGLVQSTVMHIQNMVAYLKYLPGFDHYSNKDLGQLISARILDFHTVQDFKASIASSAICNSNPWFLRR
jgi:hypothetical protein